MISKLWFVTDGVGLVGVFEDKDAAEDDLEKYQDDADFEYYSIYNIKLDEVEDYPDEYDMALAEGFLD